MCLSHATQRGTSDWAHTHTVFCITVRPYVVRNTNEANRKVHRRKGPWFDAVCPPAHGASSSSLSLS